MRGASLMNPTLHKVIGTRERGFCGGDDQMQSESNRPVHLVNFGMMCRLAVGCTGCKISRSIACVVQV